MSRRATRRARSRCSSRCADRHRAEPSAMNCDDTTPGFTASRARPGPPESRRATCTTSPSPFVSPLHTARTPSVLAHHRLYDAHRRRGLRRSPTARHTTPARDERTAVFTSRHALSPLADSPLHAAQRPLRDSREPIPRRTSDVRDRRNQKTLRASSPRAPSPMNPTAGRARTSARSRKVHGLP